MRTWYILMKGEIICTFLLYAHGSSWKRLIFVGDFLNVFDKHVFYFICFSNAIVSEND